MEANKKKLLISFSGGRTSARMAHWILNEWEDRDNWEIISVFANTGREREETLEFVDQCDKYFNLNLVWLEAVVREYNTGTTYKIVDYSNASRKGEPYEAVIQKYGIPNQAYPHCNRELKIAPIHAYAKAIWPGEEYYTAIGIRRDEPSRLKWGKAKEERLIYFLATHKPSTKSDINYFWSKQHFDLNLKSYEGNCKDCWKKAKRKLLTIAKDTPEHFDWTIEMQNKYQYFTPPSREEVNPPYRFFRDNETAEEILEESKLPFVPARDESKDLDLYKQGSFWDDYLDANGGCSESCEAY